MSKRDRERNKKKMEMVYSDSRSIIDKKEKGFSPTSIKLPHGIEKFKFKKKGQFKIDIMPYVVKHNPWADVKKGQGHYSRTYFVHRGIGPDNNDFCCLQKNWNKDCPICEHVAKLTKKGADEKLINSLKPKERELFVFINRDEKEKGPQIFETGHYKSFGEFLHNKLDAFPKGHPYHKFFHLDNGLTAIMTTKQDAFNGVTYYPVINIEFVERKPYDVSIMKKIPCLDLLPKELTYKELRKIFLQTKNVEEDDDETPEEDEEKDEEDIENNEEEESDDDGDSEDSEETDNDDEEGGDDDDNEDDNEWDNEIGNDFTFKKNGKTMTGTLVKIRDEIGLLKTKKGSFKIRLTKLEPVTDDNDDFDDDDFDDD